MLKLTEANLRALNEPSRSPSPPPVAPSPAAEIKATKFDLFATIKRLRHMGPKGLKLQREADVYIDDTGEVAYRGTDLAELDNPVFWRRQFDMLEPKCLALKRALFGPRAIYEPPKPLVIDQAAQAEQDRIDDYYFQLKRKLESWPFISCSYCCNRPLAIRSANGHQPNPDKYRVGLPRPRPIPAAPGGFRE